MIPTDMHTHILPYVDDGAASMEEALLMLGMEYEFGVRRVILTPHCGLRNPDFDNEKAKEVFSELEKRASLKYPDMKLYMGNEIYISKAGPHTALMYLKEGKFNTLAGSRYVLLEFSYTGLFSEMKEAAEFFLEAGYIPVIAHIERYNCLLGNIRNVDKLCAMGVFLQINADSLNGGRLNKVARWCNRILKQGKVHFVASDCHDNSYRTPSDMREYSSILKNTEILFME